MTNAIKLVDPKGYDSVPTKTPNRSEYQTNKPATKQSVNKHKSIIIQATKSHKAQAMASDEYVQ